MPITTEYTTFTRDVLGRYVCNTYDEALVTIDPNARAAAGPRKDHLPQNEVWGLAWNSGDPVGFPGLAYCVGGRSVFWGGWSPRLLDSELPNNRWPQAVLDDLTPKNLPDGRK